MALPLFAITLFVAAFLLFLVQPMIGKMILPNLGGTPQVWNTCMMFFQTVLLAGYAYTHTVSTRLKLRAQLIVHGVLLLAPLALLLTGTFRGRTIDWIPVAGINPILDTLWTLTLVVGLPFFVVSTSAPLLQKWFVYTGHPAAKDPYFLYGASNLGSMLSLICYPFLIEPLVGLFGQSWLWTGGYVALLVLYFVCVGLVFQAPPEVRLPPTEEKPEEKPKAEPEPETGIAAGGPKGGGASLKHKIRKGSKQKRKTLPQPTLPQRVATPAYRTVAYEEVRSDVMTPWRRLRWVLLAAAPSSLMLGITTYISTDVSAIAMFWVIPLALYLLSFILVFSKWPVVWTRQPHTLMVITHPVLVLCFVFLLMTHQISPIYRSITFSILAFFLTAMVCHGELARDRPSTKHLTEFYLWLAVGGMLGGVFNALFAPIIFTGLVELPIALALGCILRPYAHRLALVDRPMLIAFCAVVGVITLGLLGVEVIPQTLLGIQWPTLGGLHLFGAILGGFLGALAGAVFTFEPQGNGWTEKALFAVFPDFARYIDQKGKEIREEARKPAATAETEKPRRVVAAAAAPDYYLLNYAVDILLPLLVTLYTFGVMANSGDVGQRIQEFIVSTLRMSGEGAASAVGLLYRLAIYGIPLICALLFSFRPLRFGLLIAGILTVTTMHEAQQEARSGREVLARSRSYFGILRVIADDLSPTRAAETRWIPGSPPAGKPTPYTYLMHGTTHHGLNFQSPQWLRRLATTYYHRKGPVGVIMERFNWFPGPQNTYWADARMPASLVGFGGTFAPLTGQLVDLWSEPPYACIGLGTGTMSSYARPFQHMTFYEIDEQIRQYSLGEFNLPAELFRGDTAKPEPQTGPYFNYLHDALKRGANVEVVMGDARIAMKRIAEEEREANRGGAGNYQLRRNYYYAMEIDAFSSDAIPVHLITKEAIEQYLDKLAPEGVIMVHTSNRHVELVDPVTDIAAALNLDYRVCNCLGEGNVRSDGKLIGSGSRGHFQSEYVMLSRKFIDIARLQAKQRDPNHEPTQAELEAEAEKLRKEYTEAWDARLRQLREAIENNKEYDRDFKEELKDEMKKVWQREGFVPAETHSHGELPRFMAQQRFQIEPMGYQAWTTPPPPGRKVWTDDYSDMVTVMRWGLR